MTTQPTLNWQKNYYHNKTKKTDGEKQRTANRGFAKAGLQC